MLYFIGWALILPGMFFILSGVLGLLRFPDFYTKLHPASVIECCGIPITLTGLAFLQHNIMTGVKLLLIAALIFILNPVSTYALAKASLRFKIDKDGRIK